MEFVEIFEGERARRFDSDIRSRIPGYETILQLAAAALASIRPAGSVLSVGCGTGQDVLHLARNSTYHITAIDPSPDMVALAAERFHKLGIQRVDLRCCAVSDLPDEPRYDAALLSFVLHFIPDDGSKDRLLERIARRLRPGGTLILTDFAKTEAFSDDLSVLRAYLDLFSPLAPEARDEYLARVRDRLHLIAPSEYPDRWVRRSLDMRGRATVTVRCRLKGQACPLRTVHPLPTRGGPARPYPAVRSPDVG